MKITGGTSAVDTDYILDLAQRITRYNHELMDYRKRLGDQRMQHSHVFVKAPHLADCIIRQERDTIQAEQRLWKIASKMRLASHDYSVIEEQNARAFRNTEPVYAKDRVKTSFKVKSKDLPDDLPAGDSFENLTSLMEEAYKEDGSVLIQEITRADGTKSYIVVIPGLQDASGKGKNPNDLSSCSEGFNGKDSDHKKAIREAMIAHGIPDGADVMLVGHSLGGISAVGLMNDVDFTKKYNIKGVITYGSPVQHLKVLNNDIPIFSLENKGDPIPHLDDYLEGADIPGGTLRGAKQSDANRVTLEGDHVKGSAGEMYEKKARETDIVGDSCMATFGPAGLGGLLAAKAGEAYYKTKASTDIEGQHGIDKYKGLAGETDRKNPQQSHKIKGALGGVIPPKSKRKNKLHKTNRQ